MALPPWLISVGVQFVFKKWKERLARKAKAAATSATAIVGGGGLIGVGIWLQSNPEALAFLGNY